MTATDSSGKPRKRNQAQWQKILHEYEQSGLTQAAFCDQHGITKSNFYYWRKKLRTETQQSPAFVQLPTALIDSVAPDPSSAPVWDIEIELGQGRILRLRA